jgi:hypothetical protein
MENRRRDINSNMNTKFKDFRCLIFKLAIFGERGGYDHIEGETIRFGQYWMTIMFVHTDLDLISVGLSIEEEGYSFLEFMSFYENGYPDEVTVYNRIFREGLYDEMIFSLEEALLKCL